MSDIKVTFTLSEQDLGHLRKILRRAAEATKGKSETDIISAARDMARRVREAKPPQYVLERVEKLESIVALAEDKDWALPTPVRSKVLTALAYFTNPGDLIPDPIPGLGFLDDAIMIEIVAQDLRHEIKGYEDFRRFRVSAEQRPWTQVGKASLARKLAERRRDLRTKITNALASDAKSRTSRFRLW